MDINHPLDLLAGLSPTQFMQKHWQKKPLLVCNAIPGFKPLLTRTALFKLAADEQVESRLIQRQEKGSKTSGDWAMKSGPFGARALPTLSQTAWTLLVQGVDLHNADAHALLQQFRFVPDARLDDLMISFATNGGGVGPHFDSYDVFLLQASGSRKWKISKQKDLTLVPNAPLKILQNFEPDEEFVLHAGDMLYLPPRYAHDGEAVECLDASGKSADCMTYSIGFRAPAEHEIASELLQRLAEFSQDTAEDEEEAGLVKRLYRDPDQAATSTPAELPTSLISFATQAITDALKDPQAVACALGEYMTSPKPSVWFDEAEQDWQKGAGDIHLTAQTRMMYDANHVFINGESYKAKGSDAKLMQRLADQRGLTRAELAKASLDVLNLLGDWYASGWIED
ncbi:50S ribosomal protein L16 3-hydroxylase [Polaromonas vacuolata]|uniref:50S ribosomal protein L16 3-hydroxylase n=1 Tax=Polaromonas vacuolata TaxID=37448 RepID=A0A6H2HA70_9BURK|nr:cupin domain-containing protein [Polaromonas vacuolata]QJC56720.1 50S ribosomal protein L16 3-hydroxylase [Polaromonas vacuolata]